MNRLTILEQESPALNDEVEVSLPHAPECAPVSVQAGYERWAPTYDKTPNPVLALEERHLTGILPNPVGNHVLDLACGTGRWLARLARGARMVVGVDLSAAMLRVAGERAGIRGGLVLANCLQLPFQTSLFDFALCSFALNHIQQLDVMARELARTMKRRGELLICEMHPAAYTRGWRPRFRDVRGAVQIDTVGHTAESVLSCFRSAGFTCLKLHDLFFAEPERPIFLDAGRGEMFESVCHVPAIQIYEFRNMGLSNRLLRCPEHVSRSPLARRIP